MVGTEDLRSYSYYRTRYGFDGGVDYNLKPGTSVYIKGLFSDFHDFGDTWVYTPTGGNTIKAVNGSRSFSIMLRTAPRLLRPTLRQTVPRVPMHIATTFAARISRFLVS